ncbi:alpha-1,6-mannosyl-glycoprotein 2-beta-N-acetylglucosaminyltransferase-like [Apostichopus japonicus]
MRLKRLCRLGAAGLVLILVAVWSLVLTATEDKDSSLMDQGREPVPLHEKPKSGKRDLNSNINVNANPQEKNFIFTKAPLKHIPHVNKDVIAKNNINDTINIRKPKDSKIHFNLTSNLKGPNVHIRKAILDINHQQNVLNLDRFPRRSTDSIVILVMVHKRLEYLQYLIQSLSRATDIGDALLVFSHDYYSEEINDVIRAIDFCQTLQIFYPYSLQIYENEFPGPEENDCPRDAPKNVAREMKCTNWEHPDLYGHYREVQFVMTKHHWFWKLQHIFTGVQATQNHNGLILLLEEDHYVAPDFYVMLKKMYEEKKTKVTECNILTLGTYDKNRVYRDRADKADVTDWHSSKHNMGMALDKKTWLSLQECKEQFCSYDDYNWDWTLQHLSKSCLKPPLRALVLRSPRVFHIGECGIHHNGKCNADDLVRKIDENLKTNQRYLYPSNLVVTPQTRPLRIKPPKPNGGWGDLRDRTLCATYGRDVSGSPDKEES